MKNKKKLISLMTAIIVALSAAGCSAADQTTAETVTAGDAPASAAAPSAATGSSKGTASVPASSGSDPIGLEGDSPTNDYRGEMFADAEAGVTEGAKKADSIAFAETAGKADALSPAEVEKKSEDKAEEIMPDDPPEVPPVQPEAGLLTAGEWKDNLNWGFFTNLVNTGAVFFPSFGIDPRNRIAVTIHDSADKPVANAKAALLDKDKNVLWQGVAGKDGIVYLFADNAGSGAFVEVESGGKKQSFEVSRTSSSGDQSTALATGMEMTVTFDGSSDIYTDNDIMFILDTTGSMGDEMMFLQKEFTAITKAVGTDHTRYSVNFYRDKGDDYVTKCFDFTDNISELQQKLNNETADGGGDLPEAVAEILTETIQKSSWGEKSVRLAFLILDAPPHEEKADEVAAAVKLAAQKGIRLIPVVSSNSDRNTELFARAAAITTGGTYVFLTDDSGIGDSHLEPIIGDYKVEKLYDLIIRVINEYKQ